MTEAQIKITDSEIDSTITSILNNKKTSIERAVGAIKKYLKANLHLYNDGKIIKLPISLINEQALEYLKYESIVTDQYKIKLQRPPGVSRLSATDKWQLLIKPITTDPQPQITTTSPQPQSQVQSQTVRSPAAHEASLQAHMSSSTSPGFGSGPFGTSGYAGGFGFQPTQVPPVLENADKTPPLPRRQDPTNLVSRPSFRDELPSIS